jgi:hypothetical protein
MSPDRVIGVAAEWRSSTWVEAPGTPDGIRR